MSETDWSDIKISTLKTVKGSEPCVTFYLTTAKTTNLNISSALMRKEESNRYIKYGWSAKNNAIVLFFSNDASHPGASKLSKRNTSATASIQSFLNSCGIDKNKIAGKYLPEYEIIGENFAWIIYLNKKISSFQQKSDGEKLEKIVYIET